MPVTDVGLSLSFEKRSLDENLEALLLTRKDLGFNPQIQRSQRFQSSYLNYVRENPSISTKPDGVLVCKQLPKVSYASICPVTNVSNLRHSSV